MYVSVSVLVSAYVSMSVSVSVHVSVSVSVHVSVSVSVPVSAIAGEQILGFGGGPNFRKASASERSGRLRPPSHQASLAAIRAPPQQPRVAGRS